MTTSHAYRVAIIR